MKTLRTAMSLAACALITFVSAAVAKEEISTTALKQTLRSVPAAELPAKAAQLVSQAKPSDRHATTVSTVKAAVGLKPAAAPAIVGAIARAVPAMASLAAGVAAAEQPKQADIIARAAAGAAPSKTRDIVAAVCRAVPNQYRNVSLAVAQVLPGAGKEILAGVSAGIPTMKSPIQASLSGYSGSAPSLTDVLDQAAKNPDATVAAAPPLPTGLGFSRGPTIGGPYIPLSGTPTNVTTGTSGNVPPGGRDYARPL